MIQIDGYLIHSIRRAAERYGLQMTEAEYETLCRQVAEGREGCVRLDRVSMGREKWAIWLKGEWVPVVFDPGEGRIVTVLPRPELRPFAGKLPW